jgi:hypothetical protein
LEKSWASPARRSWHNRTLGYNARLRPGEAEDRETVILSPFPCWTNLAPESYRARIAELVREIEPTAAAEREKTGAEPLGAEQVTRPETLDRSPALFVHAATRKVRKELWEAYCWFVAAYREAAEKLKTGDRNAAFPPGSFPLHLPFVPA